MLDFTMGVDTFIRLWYINEALLRKNLLQWLVSGPGARGDARVVRRLHHPLSR
jgi:hypothetical protein